MIKRHLLGLVLFITCVVSAHAQSQYIAPYQGAVTRTVSSKLSDTVSVIDFGVDKTGVADASAILATMQSQIPANSPIVFPLGGTYRINTNVAMTGRIVYRNGATFVGAGSITGAISPIVSGGALGTPSSGVATNLTGTAAGLTAGSAVGSLLAIQYFTATATYTPTSGTTHAFAACVGAGGSGGGAASTGGAIAIGGAGGGGGEAYKYIASPASVTVTIGAGGAAPSTGNNAGNTGGTTSWGAVFSAPGGVGGIAGVSSSQVTLGGSAGGLPTTGDFNIQGGSGQIGVANFSLAFGWAGQGGNTLGIISGSGGVANSAAPSNGKAGGLYGGGGSAGFSYNGGGSTAGGKGADGACIVWDYR